MGRLPGWMIACLAAGVLTGCAWVVFYPQVPLAWLRATGPDGAPLELIRSHHTTVTFHRAWASEGWRAPALVWRLTPLLVALLLMLTAWRQRPLADTTPRASRSWGLGVLVVGLGAWLFWWARAAVPVTLSYGDTPALIRQIAQATWVFPAEPLMMHLFNGVSRVLTGLRGVPDGVLAGQLTAVLCGVIYLAALWSLAIERVAHPVAALLLWAALAWTGTATQFFGVIETTLLQTAGIAAFLAAATWTVRAERPTPHPLALWSLHLAAGVVLCAHAAGVALLPALLLTWVIVLRRARSTAPSARWRVHAVASALGATLLPWLLLVWWPFYRHGHFGNSAGGGDAFRFVPWDIDQARQMSDYVYYGMLSRLHAVDLLNGLVLAAPCALLLALCAVLLRHRRAAPGRPDDVARHAVLGLAALGCAGVVVLWDFDFGMWGDWNIVACYLLPLHVFGWVVFHDVMQQVGWPRPWQVVLLGPLLCTQVALGLGLWLQFHPPTG